MTESVGEDRVVARAVSPGALLPNKGINVTYARPTLPAITEKDMGDLDVAVEMGADFVALSFVRNGIDMIRLVDLLEERRSHARVIAKIEKIEAYEHLDDILAASHGVMVARGDYGVEAGFARVPLMQKDTIYRATQAGKLVITATQMFESMITQPEPTRAEAGDVANAVIDGTSAVMLSAETSVGAYPVQAVIAMSDIAIVVEESSVIRSGHEPDVGGTAAAVMHAAVTLADDVDAVALIVPTTSGGTARACAKYRRRRPIIALAHDHRVANQLALEWGVRAATIEYLATVDGLVDAALECARDLADLSPGGLAVLTAGPAVGLDRRDEPDRAAPDPGALRGSILRVSAAVAQLARASACHAEGRGFESLQPLVKGPLMRVFCVLWLSVAESEAQTASHIPQLWASADGCAAHAATSGSRAVSSIYDAGASALTRRAESPWGSEPSTSLRDE